jgi:hypothetical protein
MTDCNGHRLCVDGQCVCDKGFTGTDCTTRYVTHGFCDTSNNCTSELGSHKI